MVRVRLWLELGLGLELNGVTVIWLGGDYMYLFFIRTSFYTEQLIYRYKQGRVRRWERTQ